jgi:hypothetical protein
MTIYHVVVMGLLPRFRVSIAALLVPEVGAN